MWVYYGSKSKIVNKYPEPEYGKIIVVYDDVSHNWL